MRWIFAAFRRACDAIAGIDIPVLAAVEGLAMGAGFELIHAADIVLIRKAAVIGANHLDFGTIPAGAST